MIIPGDLRRVPRLRSLTRNRRYSLTGSPENIEMNALKRRWGMQRVSRAACERSGETRLNHRRSLAKARFSRLVLPTNARVSLIGRGTTGCLGFMWISRTTAARSILLSFFLSFPIFGWQLSSHFGERIGARVREYRIPNARLALRLRRL